jgi:hypothetical protein
LEDKEMGKLTAVFRRLADSIRGRKSSPQGFELSDDVKQEILRGLGKKPMDDLGFDRSDFDKESKEEKSNN